MLTPFQISPTVFNVIVKSDNEGPAIKSKILGLGFREVPGGYLWVGMSALSDDESEILLSTELNWFYLASIALGHTHGYLNKSPTPEWLDYFLHDDATVTAAILEPLDKKSKSFDRIPEAFLVKR